MAKASKATPAWKEEADQRTKELTDKLENGIKELFSSDKYKDFLKAMSHFHNYSARNVMLIHTQMPNATKVASFKTWKEKFNRSPKKGETSLRIYAPIGSKQPETKLFEKLDSQGKPMLDKDGNTIMEELTAVSSLNMRFKLVPVFDVSQTVGEPLPYLAEDLTGNVEHYEAFLDTLKAVSPLPIVFEPMNPEQDGYCRFGEKIGIREGMSEVQTVSAIIHEITHAKLHDRNLLAEGEKPKSKDVKEIEAESVSYVVCQKYGIETGDNSFGYLASWSDHDMKEFRASIDVIRKEANNIITAIDDRFTAICKERGIDLTADQPQQQPQQTAAKAPEEPTKPEYTTESTTQNIAGVDFSFEEVKPIVPEKEQVTAAANPDKPSKTTVEQQNFEKLSELFPQIANDDFLYQRMEASAGFMPLSVEWIGDNQLSIMHTYVQNGDLMYDPMIVFDIDREAKTATAVEFQQSSPPLYQRIEDGIGHSIDGNGNERTISGLQGQINDFATQWFTNIGNQGFVPVTAILRDEEYSDPTVYFNEDKKPYSLAFVYDSEGTTILNNLDKDENGKLTKVAYVDSYRNVEFFEDNLPKDVVTIVENVKLTNERTEQEKQAAAELNAPTEAEPPALQQTAEQLPQKPAEPMPDPTISIADMETYGYTAEDMLPLNYDRAIDLFKQDHTIFLLFNDGTEAMAFDSSEIVDHDGIYGMEREEWQNTNEYKELSAQQEQTIPTVEQNSTAEKETLTPALSEQSSNEPPPPEEPPAAEMPDIPKNEQPIYKFSSQHAIQYGEIESFHASRNLNVECGKAIDQAITDSNYEQYRYDLKNAARNVIEEFGADRVAWVVATAVNDQSWDGRLSNNTKDWAKEFDTPKPDIYLKTHLAVFDGFIKCFREVEKEKPSLMTAIKAGEQKSRAEFGGKTQSGIDTLEKTTKKNNDER